MGMKTAQKKMNFMKSSKSPKRKENIYSSQRQLIEDNSILADDNDDFSNKGYEGIPLKVLHKNKSNEIKRELNEINQELLSNSNCDIFQKTNVHSKKEKEPNGEENNTTSLIERLDLSASSSRSSIEKESYVISQMHTNTVSISSSPLNKSNNLDSSPSLGSKLKSFENNISSNVSGDKDQNLNSDIPTIDGHRQKKKKNKSKNEYIEMKEKTEKGHQNIINIKNNYVIGAHILGSGILQNHLFLCYPLVKVHIFDCKSGKDLTNDNMEELKTKEFDFHKNSSIVPHWDEVILFDDALAKSLSLAEESLFIFEIINNQQSITRKKVVKEIDIIAWAFVKLTSKNSLINRKLKLQLYNPKKTESSSQNSSAFALWENTPWDVYPSVLNVIVKSLCSSESQDIINNIKLNLLQTIHEKYISNKPFLRSIVQGNVGLKLIPRANSENCEIPNKIVKCISIEKCINILKFSLCGTYLACCILKDPKQVVFVYAVPQFLVKIKLPGHKNIIYDMCWSGSQRLITASADSTVCLWDISNINTCLLQRMTHPAFVYSSKFCPMNENVIVTGCYDKVVRVWMRADVNDDTDYTIHQELPGHEGFINVICFVARSKMFYSGDSVGVIIKWTHKNDIWIKVLLIDTPQFRYKIINDLQIFPDNHRILVVIRNSASWTFDVATSAAITCYKDGIDSRYQVRGVISPCATLVCIGNNIWEAGTGKLLAIYNPNAYDHHSIMTIDYHPYCHLIAMGCGLNGSPLLCCEYHNSHISDSKLGLEIVSPRFQLPQNNQKSLSQSIATMKNIGEQKNKYNFSDISVNPGSAIHARKDFKLWSLINKMDDAILTVKTGYKKRHIAVLEDELRSADSKDSYNDKTITVDLTEFHKKMESFDKCPSKVKNILPNEISSDKDTYTVEREILKTTSTKINHVINDSSSNLSNAESLEDVTIPTG